MAGGEPGPWRSYGRSFGGKLSASGELRGPRERPRVEVEASGQALRFMGSEVDAIELDADVDVAGKAHSTFALNVSAAEVEGVAIPQLRLTGEGNAARHALALSTHDERRRRELEPDRHGRRPVDARIRVDLRAR